MPTLPSSKVLFNDKDNMLGFLFCFDLKMSCSPSTHGAALWESIYPCYTESI